MSGSPYRYTPGRAFAAVRERSQDRLRATTLSPRDIRDLTLRLNGSPRKLKPRRSYANTYMKSPSTRKNKFGHDGLRARASLESYGPSLQRSTSGLAFDESDKENGDKDFLKTPVTVRTNRSPFSRSVLRELDVRAVRNRALFGFTNVTGSAAKNMARMG